MKSQKQLKLTNRLTLVVAAAIADLLWSPLTVHGQAFSGSTLTITGSTTFQGNVSVTGTGSVVDFYGSSLYLGTATSGTTTSPGISVLYTDGTASKFSLLSVRQSHQWSWGYLQSSGSSAPLMTLDSTNGLTVYDTSGNSIVLSPGVMGVSGASTLLTQDTADSRYVSSSDIVVGTGISPSPMGGVFSGPAISLTGGAASGAYSFAVIGATADGAYSAASGIGAQAAGDYSTASGCNSRALGWGATASGYCSEAWGPGSCTIGYSSCANGAYSIASGRCAAACGDFSTASGYLASSNGGFSTASGYYATSNGEFSTAIGAHSIANGQKSTAAGANTTATAYDEFVIGQYNILQGDPIHWIPTDNLFTIGNGSSSQSSNAFVVKKNGDTTVYGKFTVSSTNGSNLDSPSGFSVAFDNNSGAATVTGTAKLVGNLVITGSTVQVPAASGTGTITKLVASGTTPSVLIPEQGDLSMGDFVNGAKPSP